MSTQGGLDWEPMTWKRRLEISGPSRRGIPARGPGGETDGIWCVILSVAGDRETRLLIGTCSMPGELTDKGRETSLAFGKMLRRRYIDQLNLVMPRTNLLHFGGPTDGLTVAQPSLRCWIAVYPNNGGASSC
jgi:acid phosphatase